MRQWTGSSLVHVMACRLLGVKPLPEPMLAYCQLDSWKQISLKFEWIVILLFSFKKMHLEMLSAKVAPFCPGRDVSPISKVYYTACFTFLYVVRNNLWRSVMNPTHCPLGMWLWWMECENFKHRYGIVIWSIQVNIAFEWITEDSFFASGNRPLSNAVLTKIYKAIWPQ